ncbi:hypothetical protein B0T12DRAFT_411693 [Alternaria alternata]|nr:hypothetical protein B0T12DRAFT_411693 [Alternaria alternata]
MCWRSPRTFCLSFLIRCVSAPRPCFICNTLNLSRTTTRLPQISLAYVVNVIVYHYDVQKRAVESCSHHSIESASNAPCLASYL